MSCQRRMRTAVCKEPSLHQPVGLVALSARGDAFAPLACP